MSQAQPDLSLYFRQRFHLSGTLLASPKGEFKHWTKLYVKNFRFHSTRRFDFQTTSLIMHMSSKRHADSSSILMKRWVIVQVKSVDGEGFALQLTKGDAYFLSFSIVLTYALTSRRETQFHNFWQKRNKRLSSFCSFVTSDISGVFLKVLSLQP